MHHRGLDAPQAVVAEASHAVNRGYPSVAQILDVLMNAIFVDLLDQDLLGLDRVNRLLE